MEVKNYMEVYVWEMLDRVLEKQKSANVNNAAMILWPLL